MVEKIKKFIISENGFKVIYIFLFLLLNTFNLCIINSELYIKKMFVIPMDAYTFFSCLLGNIGILLFFLGLGFVIFKSDIRGGKYLLWVSGFLSFFMTGVSIYYSYYMAFPSVWNLKNFSGDGGGDAFVFFITGLFNLLKYGQYLFLLPIIVLIIVWYLFVHRRIIAEKEIRGRQIVGEWKRLVLGGAILLLGILSCSYSNTMYKNQRRERGYEELKIVSEGVQSVGIINYYLSEVSEFLFESDEVSKEKMNSVLEELASHKNNFDNEKLDSLEYQGVFEGKNLLLIQIESLNNYLIGLKVNVNGEMKEVTPNLNKIINNKSSAYFNNYYTTVGIGNTSDAEFTIMTGLYPEGYSYTVYEHAEGMNYETMPKLFNEKGYYSYSSHANIGTFYLRSELHKNLYGFNEHIDERVLQEVGVYDEEKLLHTWVNDVDFLQYNVEMMKEKYESLNQPIFNFAVTISCHMPYEMSFDEDNENDPAKNLFLEKERFFPYGYNDLSEEMMSYIEHVAYTDYAIGKAIEKMEEIGLLEDTVIIMYGDHGGGIDCSKMFEDNSGLLTNDINPISTASGEELDTLVRRMLLEVPFIIYDGSETVTFDDDYSMVRSHNSVLRTISNLFNLNNKYSFGVDALSDTVSYSYNPRNMDIILDGVTISGISKEAVYEVGYTGKMYTKEEIDEIINSVLKFKNFNDKLLKYKVFKLIK